MVVAGKGNDSDGPHLFNKSTTSLFDDKSYCWVLKSFNLGSRLKIAFVSFKEEKKDHSIQVATGPLEPFGPFCIWGRASCHESVGPTCSLGLLSSLLVPNHVTAFYLR